MSFAAMQDATGYGLAPGNGTGLSAYRSAAVDEAIAGACERTKSKDRKAFLIIVPVAAAAYSEEFANHHSPRSDTVNIDASKNSPLRVLRRPAGPWLAAV